MSALLLRPELVLDCLGGAPKRGHEVLVAGPRIESVKPVGATSYDPVNTTVVEAPGTTLLPGLIDLHTHLVTWRQPHPHGDESLMAAALRAVKNANDLLNLGVTTARDLAARDNLTIDLRELIDNGRVTGPRLLASGTPIGARGRWDIHCPSILISGVEEARAAARRQLRAGADWIKVMATAGFGGGAGKLRAHPGFQELDESELRVIADEAHRPGRMVAAHAIGTDGIKASIRAGVDCIEHGAYMDEEAIELMARRNVAFVPTLVRVRNISMGRSPGQPAYVVEAGKRTLERALRSVDMARRAGIRVGTGSEMGEVETIAEEIRLLVSTGFSAIDAIRAATQVAAHVLGLQQELGTIEPGKVADLVLLAGDPTNDLGALDRVTHVIHDGVHVKKPDLRGAVLTAP